MDVPVTATTATSDDLVDAVLGASRVLVAVAARSLAGSDADVTLPQYRALVVLAARGPQKLADLATALAVNPSTASRMCERLVRKKLVRRHRLAADRRTVRIALSDSGGALVRAVTDRRRAEIAHIVDRLPESRRRSTLRALLVLNEAAGETPEQDWWLSWHA